LNENIELGGIRFGMPEEEVIRLWGEGEYLYGMGGHGREYKEKRIRVSFPGDKDNDLYGKAAQVEFSNPEYSVFQARVGDAREEAAAKLMSAKRVKPSKTAEGVFELGEFVISLRGGERIEEIQIWFSDKDLRDRVY